MALVWLVNRYVNPEAIGSIEYRTGVVDKADGFIGQTFHFNLILKNMDGGVFDEINIIVPYGDSEQIKQIRDSVAIGIRSLGGMPDDAAIYEIALPEKKTS